MDIPLLQCSDEGYSVNSPEQNWLCRSLDQLTGHQLLYAAPRPHKHTHAHTVESTQANSTSTLAHSWKAPFRVLGMCVLIWTGSNTAQYWTHTHTHTNLQSPFRCLTRAFGTPNCTIQTTNHPTHFLVPGSTPPTTPHAKHISPAQLALQLHENKTGVTLSPQLPPLSFFFFTAHPHEPFPLPLFRLPWCFHCLSLSEVM